MNRRLDLDLAAVTEHTPRSPQGGAAPAQSAETMGRPGSGRHARMTTGR